MKRQVARWEAKGGKRFIQLYHDSGGYTYQEDTGGGVLPNFLGDDTAAIKYMENDWGANTGPVTVLRADFPSVKRVS